MDQLNLPAWTNRVTEEATCVTEQMALQIHATLGVGDAPRHGDPLPQLWHWCAFPNAAPNDLLGEDGHPRGSDLLPPIPLPRRMWAGGALEFRAPLRVGDPIRRQSSIRSIVEKETGAGPMFLVTVDHMIFGAMGLAIVEKQDIVYLNIPDRFSPPKARPMPEAVTEQITPTETLLFRYSALTFNAHRIHYDRTYTTEVEKYPDLIVHGPLQATYLMRAANRHKGRMPSYFDFRGVHPMFLGQSCDIAMQEDEGSLTLWTGQGGHQCMQATATWMETQ